MIGDALKQLLLQAGLAVDSVDIRELVVVMERQLQPCVEACVWVVGHHEPLLVVATTGEQLVERLLDGALAKAREASLLGSSDEGLNPSLGSLE